MRPRVSTLVFSNSWVWRRIRDIHVLNEDQRVETVLRVCCVGWLDLRRHRRWFLARRKNVSDHILNVCASGLFGKSVHSVWISVWDLYIWPINSDWHQTLHRCTPHEIGSEEWGSALSPISSSDLTFPGPNHDVWSPFYFFVSLVN